MHMRTFCSKVCRSVIFLPCTHVHAATDPAVTPVRDLITNVTVLHRQLDTPIPPVPSLHGQTKHGDVLFGVKKFIHFEFSLQPGFCVARQFSVRDSPAYIMSLSTENPTICQACSDFKVRVRAVVCVLSCATACGGEGGNRFCTGGRRLDRRLYVPQPSRSPSKKATPAAEAGCCCWQ